MKKLFLIGLLALSAMALKAQPSAGTFSLIPRLGVSVATLSGFEIYYQSGSENSKYEPHYKGNMTAGLDAEYQVSDVLALSLGAHYAALGCRLADHSEDSSTPQKYLGYNHQSYKLETVQVPLMAHCYVAPDLAVKIGVQLGFLADAKESYEETAYTEDKTGKREYGETTKTSEGRKDWFSKCYVSIPVGISYEYANVILDARYNYDVTKISSNEKLDCRSNYFSFTVGYRFTM